MPIACRNKLVHGPQFCATDCPASAPCGVFRYARVEAPEQLPPRDERAIDVAVLDMNHGWHNLGHDSLVHIVLDAACDLLSRLDPLGMYVRVVSFDVRVAHMLPEPPGGRFAIYVGTGGPGHLDPHRNRPGEPASQGVDENPAWEAPLFGLFDAIAADDEAALLAVCHTFGVMCRWSGVAEPRERGAEKGGKSTGARENVLTLGGQRHPWFQRFASELPDGRRLRILDSRLFDLVPGDPEALDRDGRQAIGYEWPRYPQDNALTMMEFARDRGGVMPRIFGVNHHPEIVDRARQLLILERKRAEPDGPPEGWYAERLATLTSTFDDEDTERRLRLTSEYTLAGPLRFHVQRQVRRRAEALGLSVDLHEDRMLQEDAVSAG